jgi:polysaccharide biosynthesis transport protein
MSDEQPFDLDKMPSATTDVSRVASNNTDHNRGRGEQRDKFEWKRGSVDYIGLVMRYKFWLLCGMISGLLVGHLIFQKLGPEYDATAKVLVSKRVAVPIRENGQAAETWGDRSEHIALIMSPLIIQSAVEQGKLNELPTLRLSKDPVEDILDDLKVQRSAGHDRSVLNVLDVTFKSPKREDAKVVVGAVIDAYKSFLEEQHRHNTTELVERANKAKDDLQTQIEAKEDDYEKFRESAPVHLKAPTRGANNERITSATNRHQENIELLEKERHTLRLKKSETQSKIDAIDAALASGQSREELAASIRLFGGGQTKATEGTSITLGKTSPSNDFDTRLLTLILAERKLLREFGEDWPDVVSIRDQITGLKDFYRARGMKIPGEANPNGQVAGNTGTPTGIAASTNPLAYGTTAQPDTINVYKLWLNQELTQLVLRERQIERDYPVEVTKSRALTQFLIKDRRINDDIDRLNGLLNGIQVQLAELHIEKENPGYNLQLVAPPRDQLSLKRIIKLYGAGIFLMMSVIGAMILLREWKDTTLKSVEEIRNSLTLPILGSVPAFRSSTRKDRSSLQPALCYYHRPGSPEAEAYRSVRTAFNVCLENGQTVIQVTSPEAGDGKSTLVANLAIAIAQSGRRVLLIDCDLRKPTMHRLFGMRQDIGVTDVLGRDIDLLTAVQHTVVDGLGVLTSGELPGNPAELLASPEFDRMLRDARQEYDLILVDTPPLLAVSDPCIVAQRMDGLVLVLRMLKNKRTSAVRATELIETNHIRVVGVVANGTDIQTDEYSYRETYGHNVTPEVSVTPEVNSNRATPRANDLQKI